MCRPLPVTLLPIRGVSVDEVSVRRWNSCSYYPDSQCCDADSAVPACSPASRPRLCWDIGLARSEVGRESGCQLLFVFGSFGLVEQPVFWNGLLWIVQRCLLFSNSWDGKKHLGTVLALQLTNTFFLILSGFDTNSFSGNTHRHTVVPCVSVTSSCTDCYKKNFTETFYWNVGKGWGLQLSFFA